MAKNNKDLKNSLICSFFVMLLSGAMLCGTTFAWFSETIQSYDNQIQAGTLQVDLLMRDQNGDYVTVADTTDETKTYIFNEAWTAGESKTVYLAVENKGTLTLEYDLKLTVTDDGLANVLKYDIFDVPEDEADATTLQEFPTGGTVTVREKVLTVTERFDYFAITVKMDDHAPLKYMGKSVTFSVSVIATQVTAEADNNAQA